MSDHATNPKRVLAINPTCRGFGYAVLELPAMLVDWGIVSARLDKERKTLGKVATLIARYRPEVLVLENCDAVSSRRCRRIGDLLHLIKELAVGKDVRTSSVAQPQVRKCFAAFGASTRHQIARTVAEQLPELSRHVPRYRKPWMSEDHRMSFFGAAALALAYYEACSQRTRNHLACSEP